MLRAAWVNMRGIYQFQILASTSLLARFQPGASSACGWCKDRWGISWQITPRVLTDALAAGGAEAKRVFAAMMEMGKIDIAKIEAARRG